MSVLGLMAPNGRGRLNKLPSCVQVELVVYCFAPDPPPTVAVLTPGPMPTPRPGPTPQSVPPPAVSVPKASVRSMSVNETGKQFIKSFEQGPDGNGRPALKCYDDKDSVYYDDLKKANKLKGRPRGKWTRGYGNVVTDATECERTITVQEAEDLFERDLEHKSVRIIKRLVHDDVNLTQDQFNALASYVYNTGSLDGTRLLRNINNKNFDAAVKEMDINTSQGDYMQGLEDRRNAEHKIWKTGTYDFHR